MCLGCFWTIIPAENAPVPIIFFENAAGYEYDMRFAELTKKIEGISYEYDADTTDLFTAFEAEEN